MLTYNARIGLGLFSLYLILYVGFVLTNAFSPATMETRPVAGLNLAILYGFGLIIAAILLSFVYGLIAKDEPETDGSSPGEKPNVKEDRA